MGMCSSVSVNIVNDGKGSLVGMCSSVSVNIEVT